MKNYPKLYKTLQQVNTSGYNRVRLGTETGIKTA